MSGQSVHDGGAPARAVPGEEPSLDRTTVSTIALDNSLEDWVDATSKVIAALYKAASVWTWALGSQVAHATCTGCAVGWGALTRTIEERWPDAASSRGQGGAPRPFVVPLRTRIASNSRISACLLLVTCAIVSFSAGLSTGSALGLTGGPGAPGAGGGAYGAVGPGGRRFGSSWRGLTSSRAGPASSASAPSASLVDPVGREHFFHIPPSQRVSCVALRAMRDALVDQLYHRRSYLHLGQLDAETLLPLAAGFDQAAGDVLYVDVGANVGQTAKAIMRALCDGPACSHRSPCTRRRTTVWSFEPQSGPHAKLAALGEDRRWGLCGWTVRKQALAHTAGTLRLYGKDTQASLAVSGARGTGKEGVNAEDVEVTTLDAVMAETGWDGAPPGSLFLLKIDAEGFDPYVLRGAHTTLSSRLPRLIIFEYNSKWKHVSNASVPASGSTRQGAAGGGGKGDSGSSSSGGGGCGGGGEGDGEGGGGGYPSCAMTEGGLSLRTVTRTLYEGYGYACYLYTPGTLIPLSGAWWTPPLEFYRWSNVVCAREDDVPLIEGLLARAAAHPARTAATPAASSSAAGGAGGGSASSGSSSSGVPPVPPPYSRCFINITALQEGQRAALLGQHRRGRAPVVHRPRGSAGGGGLRGQQPGHRRQPWTLPAPDPGNIGSFDGVEDDGQFAASGALGGDAAPGRYQAEGSEEPE